MIALVGEFQSANKKHSPNYKRVTHRIATRQLALDLYKEILIILERIDNELICLQNLEKGYQKYWRVGKIGLDSKFGRVINEQFRQRQFLTVDVKSLFHWIFVLDDVLGNDVFPKAITAFRNIFIVHLPEKVEKNRKIKRLMPSMFFSQYGFQLIFFPFFGSKNFSGFKIVENQVKQYIPEVNAEKNYHEKVRIIWENLDRLPVSLTRGNQQNPNHFFNHLSQYGSRSPSLLEVVISLTHVWNKKVKGLLK